MSYFGKIRTIGITFLDKSVYLVMREKKKGIDCINLCEKKTFSDSLFENEFNHFDLATEWVTAAIKKIKGYKAIPVHISIPDPVVYSHTFTFDDLPKKSTDEFVEWKLSNLYHLDKNEYGFQNSLLNTSNNNKTVLVLAIKNNLLEKISVNFLKDHIPIMEINSQSCINFYALKDSYNNECGAHIFLNEGCWSIIIWDKNKSLQTIKSKWNSVGDENTKTWKTLHANLERMIRVYIQENPKAVINNIYVTGLTSEDFIAWATANQSIVFKSMNSLAHVQLLDGCSLIESFTAIQ